jgi:hypothetical protein
MVISNPVCIPRIRCRSFLPPIRPNSPWQVSFVKGRAYVNSRMDHYRSYPGISLLCPGGCDRSAGTSTCQRAGIRRSGIPTTRAERTTGMHLQTLSARGLILFSILRAIARSKRHGILLVSSVVSFGGGENHGDFLRAVRLTVGSGHSGDVVAGKG